MAGAGRVLERRRAVALARHYREFEGLSIRQIADRLGRSPATIKAYFYDPTGEGEGGQGPLPGGVPRLRGVHPAAQRQRGRLRVLQGLPPGRDRAALDAGARDRSDARVGYPVRPYADLVRLVADTRASARGRGAHATARRLAVGERRHERAGKLGRARPQAESDGDRNRRGRAET